MGNQKGITAANPCNPWCCLQQLHCQSVLSTAFSRVTHSSTAAKVWQAVAKNTCHTSRSLSSPPFNLINMYPVNGTHVSQTHCTQTNEYASNKKNPLLQQQLCQSLVAISFLISLLVLSMIDAMEREH